MTPFDRRHFCLGGLGVFGALGLGAPLAARNRRGAPRTLVLVQLSGGNDGLSTIVPYGDDAYGRARKETRVESREVLRIDELRGFHPELKALAARFQEGGLAVVEGVGYPAPNRSHFKSLDIWHAADRRGRSAGQGWIGRACEAAFGDSVDSLRVVHIGDQPPYSVYSTRHPASSFTIPQGYRWVANEAEVAQLVDDSAQRPEANAALAHVRAMQEDALASSVAIRRAAFAYRPTVDFPSGPFGSSLRSAAALIHADLGCRVVSVELDGFDTHNDQRRRHDRQMTLLDEGLGAFLRDLEASEAGRNTVVLVFSEFGRRVAENGSRGTDHGCAGPVFVAGTPVKGGLLGAPPSLTELDRGDLVFTTDFRRVYATLLEQVFELDPAEVLGASFDPLPLV